ncbi:MAG: c-type cytochrome biogenesis protein CcmI [Devosiaceae bacterium]
MLVWIVFAVMTAVAAVAVLLPYARARQEASDAGGSDAEVYKDQLGEIEKDVERGALSETEADAARLEISRRLLKANDLESPDHAGNTQQSPWRSRTVLATAFLLVPISAIAIYLTYGSPGLNDQPLAQRLEGTTEQQDAAILIARVEDAVSQNPDDVRGWAVLAPIYSRQGRFEDARRAYNQLLRLEGPLPTLLTDLGELIVVENQGLVTEEAMGRFVAALNEEPSFPKARYYRALGLVQDGREDEARAVLIALRNDGGPDAPWSQSVNRLLDDMDQAALLPSPSGEVAQSIASLSSEDREQAILDMVQGLADRLSVRPDDLAGWSQLIRAYVVLERPADASQSLAIALRQFAADSPARQRLLTIAQELELDIPQ